MGIITRVLWTKGKSIKFLRSIGDGYCLNFWNTKQLQGCTQGRSQTKYDGGATELQPTCLKANLHAIR